MKDTKLKELAQKERERQEQYEQRIFCCTSTACLSAGAGLTHTAVERGVAANAAGDLAAEVVQTGCMGLCSRGPLVRVESKKEEPILYGDVTAEVAQQIVNHHLPADTYVYDPDAEETEEKVTPHDFMHFRAGRRKAGVKTELAKYVIPLDLPFFSKQFNIVLSETGHINPEKLEDYLAHGR